MNKIKEAYLKYWTPGDPFMSGNPYLICEICRAEVFTPEEKIKHEKECHSKAYKNEPPAASQKQVGGSHYSKLKIQPAFYAHQNNLGGLEMNVVKYVTRYKDKGGIEDLRKAIHCLELLIEYTYGRV